MKRLLYWLGLVTLVWTQDVDGDIRLCIVRYDKQTGDGYVYAVLGPVAGNSGSLSRLEKDGSLTGGRSYVRRWFPYASKPLSNSRLTWRKP